MPRSLVFLLLLAAGWAAGSALRMGSVRDWTPRDGRIRVLTTILPIYDFAREVGGPDVEVRNLLPPGVDPHEFALAPHDVSLAAGADVVAANGAGLDGYVEDALRRAGALRVPVLELTEGLPKLAAAERERGETGDPHLWLDPVYAETYVCRLEAALCRAAPAKSPAIRLRAEAYLRELERLDHEYRERLAPMRGRAFVAFHGAFGYLARRYGLEVAAVWEETPGREPGPRDVGTILARARAAKVRAAFVEPQFSPRALEMIAADSHLPVYTLDPMETAPSFRGAHYLDTMRRNLDVLVRALSKD